MTEAEETIQSLKNFGNGAHAHTANKCAYYLEIISGKTSEKVKCGGIVLSKQEWIDKLILLARKAMSSNDWNELKVFMISWW
jgi:hypothetical protein